MSSPTCIDFAGHPVVAITFFSLCWASWYQTALRSVAGRDRPLVRAGAKLISIVTGQLSVHGQSSDGAAGACSAKRPNLPSRLDDIEHLIEARSRGRFGIVQRVVEVLRPRTHSLRRDAAATPRCPDVTPGGRSHRRRRAASRLPVREGDLDHIIGFENIGPVSPSYLGWHRASQVTCRAGRPRMLLDRLLELFQNSTISWRSY